MPAMASERLRAIKTLPQLLAYLRNDLDWPIEANDIDDLTFDYTPEELGLKPEHAVKIKEIKQLRPLETGQPWGIFYVNFEKKRLPVVILRRILRALVIRKRSSANKSERKAWQPNDLLFISTYGEETDRAITFAHFVENEDYGNLAELRVLGWDDDDTPLKYDYIAQTLHEKLCWRAEFESNQDLWRKNWSEAFVLRHREVITTSKGLAIALAGLAKRIRGRVRSVLRHEDGFGEVRKLQRAFQQALIHDLSDDDFADMYAQTVTYGLFSAAVSRCSPAEGESSVIVRENLADMVPKTNPFLHEMLGTFLNLSGRSGKIDFDELGINDVVAVLNSPNTHLDAVLRDFGNRTRQEDPVIHFYELFLTEYDKKRKIQRGVFYTPQPVVSYIVRSVHELLQTEFGLEDGLASTITWREMMEKNPNLKLPNLSDDPTKPKLLSPNEPFVQILDPATGTATFLVEVIEVIFNHLKNKWEKQGRSAMPHLPDTRNLNADTFSSYWNEYVPKHLLPRLHGYELMMAPYAIAHMKIGLKLAETGYRFGTDERARIYLTNALEPKMKQLPTIGFEALAHEAAAVNEVKWHKRFTVVIGNPPYSVSSQNDNPWIDKLTSAIKERVRGERNIQPLNDDYIKFLTLASHLRSIAGCGTLSMITNRSFINGKIHPGLRELLLRMFPAFAVVDLGGDTRSGETQLDENVFDITQGVAISLWSSLGEWRRYVRVMGLRAEKYEGLVRLRLGEWVAVQPRADAFLLTPQDDAVAAEYKTFPSLRELMPFSLPGVKTSKDAVFYAFTEEELREQIREEGIRWNARCVTRSLYRPLDWRYLYYDPAHLGRSRQDLAYHVLDGKTVSLIAMRQVVNETVSHFGVCRGICCHGCFFLGNKGQDYQHPLQLHEDPLFRRGDSAATVPNVSAVGQSWIASVTGEPAEHNATAWLHYVYAVVHSTTYRTRYVALLKDDFPRLPLTSSLDLFRALAKLGGELVALHLMESPRLDKHITKWVGGKNPEVEKVSFEVDAASRRVSEDKRRDAASTLGTVFIDKAQTTGFAGVPETVWNFHIGGYQVCEKWLKDRKGRKLSQDDIAHYHKIVVALHETIRLMTEIDTVIAAHGGWPGAFTTSESVEYPAKQSELKKAAESGAGD